MKYTDTAVVTATGDTRSATHPVQQIADKIAEMEEDTHLRDLQNYSGRARCLDWIDSLQSPAGGIVFPMESRQDSNSSLHPRLKRLRQEFEDLNRDLCNNIRRDIASGQLRGEALRVMLCNHSADESAVKTADDESYGIMDALVADILLVEHPPEPTTQLETGMVAYQPTPVRTVLRLVDGAEFSDRDIFCDIGSGLGLVVMLVHLLTGVYSQGIELEPVYCDYSRRCADSLNLSSVEFLNHDVRDMDLSRPNHFFLYTPFTGQMLQDVLLMLRNQAETRSLQIYTFGPCTPVVAQQAWLNSFDGCESLSQGLGHFSSTLHSVDRTYSG